MWEEICVQVQQEQSFFWDAYDETVRLMIRAECEALPPYEKAALWQLTDAGWEWRYDEEPELPRPLPDDELEDLLAKRLYDKAGAWTNERIEEYLDAQGGGCR